MLAAWCDFEWETFFSVAFEVKISSSNGKIVFDLFIYFSINDWRHNKRFKERLNLNDKNASTLPARSNCFCLTNAFPWFLRLIWQLFVSLVASESLESLYRFENIEITFTTVALRRKPRSVHNQHKNVLTWIGTRVTGIFEWCCKFRVDRMLRQ